MARPKRLVKVGKSAGKDARERAVMVRVGKSRGRQQRRVRDRLDELFQRHDRDVGNSRPGSRQWRKADANLVRGIDRGFKRGESVTPSEKAKAVATRVAFTTV